VTAPATRVATGTDLAALQPEQLVALLRARLLVPGLGGRSA